jgi:hypothetical protein
MLASAAAGMCGSRDRFHGTPLGSAVTVGYRSMMPNEKLSTCMPTGSSI